MASSIDVTKPVSGSPTTLSVRDNFGYAKTEIEALQALQNPAMTTDNALVKYDLGTTAFVEVTDVTITDAGVLGAAAPAFTGAGTAVDWTVSGTFNASGTFQIGGVAVDASAAELNILDGVTATTAELNKLAGVATTATELGYVAGVSSAIQTQMDLKAPLASPTLTTPTLTDATFSGGFVEDVYDLGSGSNPAIDPANGTIQTFSGNGTPTDSLAAGESVLVMATGGSAITWSMVDKWSQGVEPPATSPASNYMGVQLVKLGSTLYGTYVGEYQ